MMIIETERLVIRRLYPGDAPFILALLNDEGFLRYIGDRHVRTLVDAERYIAEGPMAMYERYGFGLYLVTVRATGEPAGICGVLKRDALKDADLGFALMPRFRGAGYALEAAAGVQRYARDVLRLPRLAAIVQPNNTRSMHLLQLLGYRPEGTVRLAPDAEELSLLGIELPPPDFDVNTVLHFCVRCGQQVDPYEPSRVEPGNPAGDTSYFCRACGLDWPAPNVFAPGEPCVDCRLPVPPDAWHCPSCGRGTLANPAPQVATPEHGTGTAATTSHVAAATRGDAEAGESLGRPEDR